MRPDTTPGDELGDLGSEHQFCRPKAPQSFRNTGCVWRLSSASEGEKVEALAH
jgi:hypothetical protein